MPSTQTPDTWTTRKLLAWTADHLRSKGVDSPRLAADLLLAHVLKQDRIRLYADMDRPASDSERAAFRAIVERAAKHEPVQYLVGEGHFYSLRFKVDRRVLIPRPSTETLVEHIIHHVRSTAADRPVTIADIGTGSGAIAITLAKNLPHARITATDQSTDALQVAAENTERLGMADRIEFLEGDLLQPLGDRIFDVLVSNPPYISDAEWADVPANVKDHEPVHALRAGPDGLDLLRPLIEQGHQHVQPGGRIVLEIAASQKDAVLQLAAPNRQWKTPRVENDLEKLPRMFVAERAASCKIEDQRVKHHD